MHMRSAWQRLTHSVRLSLLPPATHVLLTAGVRQWCDGAGTHQGPAEGGKLRQFQHATASGRPRASTQTQPTHLRPPQWVPPTERRTLLPSPPPPLLLLHCVQARPNSIAVFVPSEITTHCFYAGLQKDYMVRMQAWHPARVQLHALQSAAAADDESLASSCPGSVPVQVANAIFRMGGAAIMCSNQPRFRRTAK